MMSAFKKQNALPLMVYLLIKTTMDLFIYLFFKCFSHSLSQIVPLKKIFDHKIFIVDFFSYQNELLDQFISHPPVLFYHEFNII